MMFATYPRADLALVAASDGVDVVLDDGCKGSLVVDGGDPARKLRVPN